MAEVSKITRPAPFGLHPIAVRNHRHPASPLVDPSCPGLRLVASRTTRAWIYRYELDGRMKQTWLGDADVMGLAEARIEWDKRVKLRKSGVDIRRSAAKQAAEVQRTAIATTKYTVGEMIDDFEREHLQSTKSGSERARTLRFDTANIASRTAASITRADVQSLLDEIKARGARRIAVMVLGELKRAFEHAVARERIAYNPAAMVRSKIKAVSRDRRLTDSDLRKLFTLIGDATKLIGLSASMRDAMRLELATACRQAEVFGMRYDELELDLRNNVAWWHIPAKRMKMAKPHSVHLHAVALEVITARKLAQQQSSIITPFLFPNPTDPSKSIGPHAIVWSLCQIRDELSKAGIRHFTMHDLRRTAVSIIAGLGYSRQVQNRCAAQTENSVAATCDSHDYTPEAIKAWDALGAHLMALWDAREDRVAYYA